MWLDNFSPSMFDAENDKISLSPSPSVASSISYASNEDDLLTHMEYLNSLLDRDPKFMPPSMSFPDANSKPSIQNIKKLLFDDEKDGIRSEEAKAIDRRSLWPVLSMSTRLLAYEKYLLEKSSN